MPRPRALLIVLVTLAYALSAWAASGRVLCIEPDGTIAIEVAGACCGDEGGAATEDSLESPRDCCACVDIPLATANGARLVQAQLVAGAPAAFLPCPAPRVEVASPPFLAVRAGEPILRAHLPTVAIRC